MFREILSTLHRKLNKNQKAMDLLHEFENHLPVPILFEELYEGKHYPSFIDITRTEALRKRYIEKMKEQLKKRRKTMKYARNVRGILNQRLISRNIRYCPKN
jgi:hypothetical protein